MVAFLHDRRLNGRIHLVVAIAAAVLAAAGAFAIPEWRLTALVETLRLPSLIAAAAPPLGTTARALLAVLAGGAAGAIAGAATWLALRGRTATIADDVPVLRRADAHPDAPARRPIRASEDLGQPMPIAADARAPKPIKVAPVDATPIAPVPISATPISAMDVPVDLDTPLAAIDPAAIPPVPREPVRPVPALAATRPQIIDPGERFETFELTPIRRTPRPEAPAAAPAPAVSSIGSLIERLEKGAARRETRPAATIEETLGMLRALATR